MTRGSLRLRLIAGALLWSAGALAAAGALFAATLRGHLEREYAIVLKAHLEELQGVLQTASTGGPGLARPLSDPRFARPLSGLYWQVDGPGAARLRSASLGGESLVVAEARDAQALLHVVGPQGKPLIAVEARDGTRRLIVAGSGDDLDLANEWTTGTTAIGLAALAAALMAGGVVQVRRGLAPIDALRARLAAIRSGTAARLEGRYPSEVQPLVEDLNGLLEHGAAAVVRARTAAGSLAHGLKTPLAVVVNEVRRLEAAGQGEAAGVIGAQAQAMQRHIDYQLARARAAASGQNLAVRCPVAPLVDRLVRTMGRLHESRQLQIVARADGGAAFRGDGEDLAEMLGNLLDNACKWASGRVEVGCSRDGAQLIFDVDDDGPGVDADARGALLQRMSQPDAGAPGSGLGLRIVSDLADVYGGSLGLSPSPLGGLRATLRLPEAHRDKEAG
jgi:signal transduction histidine kinase